MSTIAELELPAAEFALYDTLAGVDSVRFEVERVVAHGSERIMPLVWASDADGERVDTALREDSSVGDVETLADLGDEQLYRMEWVSRIRTLVRLLVEERGTIMAASSDEGVWHLRLLFPERAALSRTYTFCEEAELNMEIVRVYDLDEGRQGRYGLTDLQQDALVVAFERGYYRVPRETSANELADELGISHQALSERLRRAHESLVENTIVLGRAEEQR